MIWKRYPDESPDNDFREYLLIVDVDGLKYHIVGFWCRNLAMLDEAKFANKKGVGGFINFDPAYGYHLYQNVLAWSSIDKCDFIGEEGMI